MDHALYAYLPQDRRLALSRGVELPHLTHGAALFADISGFTALTEALTRELGPRRGAEELPRRLNLVYDALIGEVERYGGSVIGFAGDAITCWFDGDDGLRACTCALAMQEAMPTTAQIGGVMPLAMKVGIATGPVRRFLVGDPQIQRLEVLAGQVVEQMTAAEEQARKGEIILEGHSARLLQDKVQITEWRAVPHAPRPYAVVGGVQHAVPPMPWPPLSAGDLLPEQVRAWLLPVVYERLHEGMGEFLAELRPVTALFLRIGGIEYDGDAEVGSRLDAYIRWVQGILSRYEGTLIQLTIGEKGSYLYAAFGAPIAHEDDSQRAVSAALELRTPPAGLAFRHTSQGMGLSRGTMRAGAYGSTSRRTYGVLGDEVNLAARLMAHAAPGEILGSGRVQHATRDIFAWDTLSPIEVKGRSEPLALYRLAEQGQVSLGDEAFDAVIVGREGEINHLLSLLEPLWAGKFVGLISLYGEAGMGKSRLVHALQQALFPSHLGGRGKVTWFTCPAEGILRQSLRPFRQFLRLYLDQGFDRSEGENKRRFEHVLATLARILEEKGALTLQNELERVHPFLGALVGLHWEGSLYEQLEPRLRFENTLAAFKTLVLAESQRQPVVLHIEDAHWLDGDSLALLKELTHQVEHYPFVVLLTSRYQDDGGRSLVPLHTGVPHQVIDLDALSPSGSQELAARVAGGDLAAETLAFVVEKTSGNPFFIEQLTLDLRERGILVRDAAGCWALMPQQSEEVPEGINAVLVARLDRLTAQVRAVVQTAAVLGQEFEVRILSQMLQEDALLPTKVKQAEREAIWYALNDIRYLFRHALLRDAAYDMQLEARLRELHRLAAGAIEQSMGNESALSAYYADLAHHYGRAEDRERECHYARKAGEQAAARFANDEAASYLSRALFLLPEVPAHAAERYGLLLLREQVYDLQGAREAQRADLVALASLAVALRDEQRRAEVALRQATYHEVTGEYPQAIAVGQQVVAIAQAAALTRSEATGYLLWGRVLWRQAEHREARTRLEQALTLAQAGSLVDVAAESLRVLGLVAWHQGDYMGAKRYLGKALQHYRSSGQRRGESATLENLGFVSYSQGEYLAARAYAEQALTIAREIGNQHGESIDVGFLGLLYYYLEEYESSRQYSLQAMQLALRIGAKREEGYCLINLAHALFGMGRFEEAVELYHRSVVLRRTVGEQGLAIESIASLARALHRLGEVKQAQEWVEEVLVFLASSAPNGADDPIQLYLTCYHVLSASGDNRARAVLLAGHALLLERASALGDEATRQSFLRNVPSHREVLRLVGEQDENDIMRCYTR